MPTRCKKIICIDKNLIALARYDSNNNVESNILTSTQIQFINQFVAGIGKNISASITIVKNRFLLLFLFTTKEITPVIKHNSK